jgi:hypothetical protein
VQKVEKFGAVTRTRDALVRLDLAWWSIEFALVGGQPIGRQVTS